MIMLMALGFVPHVRFALQTRHLTAIVTTRVVAAVPVASKTLAVGRISIPPCEISTLPSDLVSMLVSQRTTQTGATYQPTALLPSSVLTVL